VKKKSALEDRLRRLEEEEALLEQHIRSLRKTVKRNESLSSAPEPGKAGFRPARSAYPSPHPHQDHADPLGGRPPVMGLDPASAGAGAAADGASDDSRAQESHDRRQAIANDSRFANYFSAGSIMPARPVRQDRGVQRNKAIFLAIIAVILSFIVFQLVF